MLRAALVLATALVSATALAQTAQQRGPFDSGTGPVGGPGGLLSGSQAQQLAALPIASLREVATRARLPNGFSAANTQFMAESVHTFRTAVSQVTVLVPNWGVTIASTNEERSPGGPAQIRESISVAGGPFLPMTCDGTTGLDTVADGANATCVANVTVPKGATVKLREFYSNPLGIVFSLGNAAVYAPDTIAYGASGIPDLTAGGAITPNASSGTVAAFPVAILGLSRDPAYALVGDSRVQGVRYVRDAVTGDGGELEPVLNARAASINMGISGDLATWAVKSFVKRAALFPYTTTMVNEYGINDLVGGGQTAAAAEAARTAIDALYAPYGPVLGTTLAPYTSTTDGCATLGNQTVTSAEAARLQVNTDIRAGLAPEQGVIDLDAGLDPTATGKWPVGTSPDCVHESRAGGQVEQRSGIWGVVPTP